ncbi:tetratricopeptide repeat protein [Shewanella sp. NIFS-20-20]|uniref:tetratricopeptide repeat protein n=1 Tax=Shewanella sp. NIFS-20-20 TaxID=2853806 RepID=UPI001C458C23|nr:tetratricopeptide repeat protein [Shewanella sp. NIFS-20-20]MBV7315142.1 tetratricopeptide repeat protein [Shewanella sp. NIFS-20-20]
MNGVIDLTKENIQQVVDASMQQLVVLAFWSPSEPTSLAVLEQLSIAQPRGFLLAKVNCDTEMEIAGYFRIQTLPTLMLLQQGQPVDALMAPMSTEMVGALLDKHVQPLWQLQLAQAMAMLQAEDDSQLAAALALLQQAQQSHPCDEVSLAMADVYLQQQDIAQAEQLLSQVGLAGQDGYYANLVAKLALAKESTDSPEIRALEQALAQLPDSAEARQALAKAYHQVRRDEDSLAILFEVLRRDMNAADGELKKTFMEIMTALGQGNSVANQYRRKLYSLLY